MTSEEELHSMAVIGEMRGTIVSFLPLSICILYVMCITHPFRFDAFEPVY